MENTQISPGSIVVGYDGSAHADRALDWAAGQAELEGRPLVVLHAARDDDTRTAMLLGAGVVPVPSGEVLAYARSVAQKGADLVLARRPQLPVSALPTIGDPRQQLAASSTFAAMVVVGSRGRGPVTSALLGSVGAHLARHLEGPLVVCRPGNPGQLHDGVAVAADATSTSRPVLEQAFRHASLRGLPLTIVHCVGGTSLEDERRALAESTAGFREKFPDVSVDLRLSTGSVEAALRHDRPWNLVVVGRHPLDALGRRIGHVTATDVLEHSDAVVLVVPLAGP